VNGQLRLLPVISAGGVIGALARYGIGRAFPVAPGTFPWSTFAINVIGCFLIGVLMAIVVHTSWTHPMGRPFLGVGILGGFTTFSTYAVDTVRLGQASEAGTAILYLFGTLLAAMLAVYVGLAATRRVLFHVTVIGERT
jgi:CrcB protein